MTRRPSYGLLTSFFLIGMFIASFLLYINQQFPIALNLASILSPTGAQVSVAGFRIKHWLVGFLVEIFGFGLILTDQKPTIKQLAFVVLGIGFMLILDEYEDVYNFIINGEYI